MDWQKHIHTDPAVLLGKPVIKGTRISVEFILERLGNGWTEQDLLQNYQQLTLKDLQAVFFYAWECLQDGLLYERSSNTLHENFAQ